MRSFILCRERLDRIQLILERNTGSLAVREFARTFSVWKWEIEQAAELGFIKIETHKPRTGRPSRIVLQVSRTRAAKLPLIRPKTPPAATSPSTPSSTTSSAAR